MNEPRDREEIRLAMAAVKIEEKVSSPRVFRTRKAGSGTWRVGARTLEEARAMLAETTSGNWERDEQAVWFDGAREDSRIYQR